VTAIHRFGPFALDALGSELRCHGAPVPLPPKALELLALLVRRAGEVVTAAEILDALWPDEEVTEGDVTQQAFILRRALADASPDARYVATVPRIGYRFVAPVSTSAASGERDLSDARRATLRGSHLAERRTADDLRRALGEFASAIATDPLFAPAHAGAAEAYLLLGAYLHEPPEASFPAARAAAERALALDPALADAHAVLGEVALHYDRDLRAARASYDRARHHAPASADVRVLRMRYFAIAGDLHAAYDEIAAALAREPHSPKLLTNAAVLDIFSRSFESAARTLADVREMDPEYEPARYYLATARALAGGTDAAIALYRGATDYDQRMLATLGYARGRAGDRAGALRHFNALKDGAFGFVSPFNLATICAGIGDLGATLHHLERGAAQRDPWLVIARTHPFFDIFRDDGRFTSFLAGTIAP
jgi:DNA-binding winged helix-turn-helix (wHTH) protein